MDTSKPKKSFWRRFVRESAPAVREVQVDARFFDDERQPMANIRTVYWDGDAGSWKRVEALNGTAEMRRVMRSEADIARMYASVFAAIRKRSVAMSKFKWKLMRKMAGGDKEVELHPALDAINRVNSSTTSVQGKQLIEQHKLTFGEAYWVKRRDGLGTVIEFEIWDPATSKPVPKDDKAWEIKHFERDLQNGSVERVQPKDMIFFRHMIDPSHSLRGLSPIGAIRTWIDTGFEAVRFNQRVFDNDTMLGHMFTVEDAGPAELKRIEGEIERKFKGTDKAHSAWVVGGNVKVVESLMSHKDLQFLEQQQWTVEETARVFEMSPNDIGDMRYNTFSNADQTHATFWEMMLLQAENTAQELTEFFLWPDYGDDLYFKPDFSAIAALASDKKTEVEIDASRLGTAQRTVNELRERDGLDPVPWGDVPILPSTMVFLPESPEAAEEAAAKKTADALALAAAAPAPSKQVPPGGDGPPRPPGDTEKAPKPGPAGRGDPFP